ncbi:MAG: ABC transporter permease subunit [Verrucomicrobiota bacterium]|nr:ABC transporter permease subunit [Verrucomicrobiota bacterium]
MRAFAILLRRELAAFFLSLTGYVVIAAVTLLIGATFVMLIKNMGTEAFPLPVTEIFFNSSVFWIIVILTAPVITMRLFAFEKASGTYETLMTAPVGDVSVVAAKFVAALTFYMVMWLPTLGCLLIVSHFTNQAHALDKGLLGGMYLGIFLSGCLFLSIGCFTSSLTRSQMTAAMMSLAIGIIFFLAAYAAYAQVIPETGPWRTASVLYYFNLFRQMEDFTRGVADTRAMIFNGSAMFLFLFLTLRVVESRRWK